MKRIKLILLITSILLLGACAGSRKYPQYSKKYCHWDPGGHEYQMIKKNQVQKFKKK